MRPNMFFFGLGYVALMLAAKLKEQGFVMTGTTRSPQKKTISSLALSRIDFNSPDIETYLGQATHMLISIPPTRSGNDLVLIQYGDLIKKYAKNLQWVGYLSSTGVYGDHQGAWVDERSACIPHTPSGIARLKAEKSWVSFAESHQIPLHVFRLSGIYGPQRNAIERLLLGKKHSVYQEGQVFCRIHVADIVATLCASIQTPNPLSIYNVSDDEPAPTHVVDEFAAKLIGHKPPALIPLSEAILSPMEREFYANNRRVSNKKIKTELGITLRYPSYKEGLTDLWHSR